MEKKYIIVLFYSKGIMFNIFIILLKICIYKLVYKNLRVSGNRKVL